MRTGSREKWTMMQECAVRKLASHTEVDRWITTDPQWISSANSIVIFPTPYRMSECIEAQSYCIEA